MTPPSIKKTDRMEEEEECVPKDGEDDEDGEDDKDEVRNNFGRKYVSPNLSSASVLVCERYG